MSRWLVLLLLVTASVPARADEWLHPVYWDQCSSKAQYMTFAGPGIYRQGMDGVFTDSPTLIGHQVKIWITPSNSPGNGDQLPDAWRFDGGGCQAGKLAARADLAGCLYPPLAPPGAITTVTLQLSGPFGNELTLTLDASYPPTTAEQYKPYQLFRVLYDLNRAAVGPQNPSTACGGAERQVCFLVTEGSWIDEAGFHHPAMVQGPDTGSAWELDPSRPDGCWGDVPTLSSTWGRVRAQYR